MIKGIVLAGGRSRRFGSDKALAAIGSMTMIEKSATLLKELGLEPVVVTHESSDYSFLKYPILRDAIPNKGPLGGLYTAMSSLEGVSLLALTCDMPWLTIPILRVLIQAHKKENLATCYSISENQWLPFPGIYESFLCQQVFQTLQTRDLSLHGFLENLPRKHLLSYRFPLDHIRNINTASEL